MQYISRTQYQLGCEKNQLSGHATYFHLKKKYNGLMPTEVQRLDPLGDGFGMSSPI